MTAPPLYPWGDNRPFYSYKAYFHKLFGGRVQKLSVDAGFTCPNHDGSKGRGGCTYCNNDAFNPSYCQTTKSITQQLEEGKAFHAWRYRRAVKYLAYFQAFSNTYASLEELKTKYEEALAVKDIIGLVISTRADCVWPELLEYLQSLRRHYYIHIELGIESCYNETLARIHRGHTFEETAEALRLIEDYGITAGGHLIFGLPGESREIMLAEAQIVSRLPLTTIKFHQLQIIKGTSMARHYALFPNDFHLFDRDEYINFIVRFCEQLSPSIVIERFTSEAPPRFVIAPDWGLERADELLRSIEKKFIQWKTWQGKNYSLERL